MHIVFAHHNPLPVATYGGAERILFWLMKSLVRHGHRVTLIGHHESKVSNLGIDLIAGDASNWFERVPRSADLVQVFFPWHRELEKPFLCAIGGNGKPGEKFPINTVFVSRSHAQNHGATCFVYNGLDFDEYPEISRSSGARWQNFAFLAKASWKVKNLRDCVRAARRARKDLHVCGGRAWTLSRYVHSHGMINQKQKLQILSQCDALLWPVRWPEPFGIAPVEAMACGIPVLASQHGSGPELVTPETGVICHSYDEFAEAVASAPALFDAKKIRAHAQQKFGIDQMTRAYLNCYERILAGESLNASAPVTQFSQPPETPLPF